MTTYYDANRKKVSLGAKLGEGGEGAVYAVQGNPRLVAKIYAQDKLPVNVAKLSWMIAHPPHDPTAPSHTSIAWPQALLFDGAGACRGFTMPRIDNTWTLYNVYHPRERRKIQFPFTWRYFHRVARNFASATAALHDAGYVIGDVNESNAEVTNQAMVTLVDTDSFQVREGTGAGATVHRSTLAKAPFLPPELIGEKLAEVDRGPQHDRYGLAVLIFQLLLNGVHPFNCIWKGPGDTPSATERIKNGYYPHQKLPHPLVAPPPQVPTLDILHPDLVFLFQRCFVDGFADPNRRPTADEWHDALEKAEATLTDCGNGHVFSKYSSTMTCPWCARAGVTPRKTRGVQTPLAPVAAPVSAPQAISPAAPSRTGVSPPPSLPGAGLSVPRAFPISRRALGGGGIGVLALALLLLRPWGGGGVPSAAILPDPTSTPAPTATAVPPTATVVPTATPLPDLASGCWTVEDRLPALSIPGESRRYQQWSVPPRMVIDPAERYVATIATSKGTLTVQLEPQAAPLAVNNFVCLARAGFYDDTRFHKIVPGLAVQGGDPAGSGFGGPGYLFADEPIEGEYRRGTLALVNNGPDSNGSQFFMFLDDLSERLPRRYTIFGHITLGLDVLDEIASDRENPATIEQVTITQSG